MKTGWLLYDACDYANNLAFVQHMQRKAKPLDIALQAVFTEDIEKSLSVLPDFIISRQRNYTISMLFEKLGIPVFNSARVCELCNDKQKTYAFLEGLPGMPAQYFTPDTKRNLPPEAFPLVVKPSFGHGGQNVRLVENNEQLSEALASVFPQTAVVQELASEAGKDLRVYVLFGRILAGVMRTANTGIVSNYKRGGNIALHTLTQKEKSLSDLVIRRFTENGAPLSFAGIDFIYHNGEPVVNEIEDVVGSRMLYKVSAIDCIDLYIKGIAQQL